MRFIMSLLLLAIALTAGCSDSALPLGPNGLVPVTFNLSSVNNQALPIRPSGRDVLDNETITLRPNRTYSKVTHSHSMLGIQLVANESGTWVRSDTTVYLTSEGRPIQTAILTNGNTSLIFRDWTPLGANTLLYVAQR